MNRGTPGSQIRQGEFQKKETACTKEGNSERGKRSPCVAESRNFTQDSERPWEAQLPQRTTKGKTHWSLWLFLFQKITGIIIVRILEEVAPRQGPCTVVEVAPCSPPGAALCINTTQVASCGVMRCTSSAPF